MVSIGTILSDSSKSVTICIKWEVSRLKAHYHRFIDSSEKNFINCKNTSELKTQ